MVPVLAAASYRCADSYALLHRESAVGVHILEVHDLILGAVRAVLDLAERHGLVRARKRAGQVLFVEPDCERLIGEGRESGLIMQY